MSKRGRAPQQARAPAGAPKRRRKGPRKNDLYEAEDSDPEEDKRAERYDVSGAPRSAAAGAPFSPAPAHPAPPRPPQRVENYEYELPSDFEDEEIDEDLAFTAEDKERFAGWFGDDGDGPGAAAAAPRARGEFADLDSSDSGGGEEEGEDDAGEEVRVARRRGVRAAAGGGTPRRLRRRALLRPGRGPRLLLHTPTPGPFGICKAPGPCC
jgi:U3 small nucleolar RNA-associated protein 14